MNYVYLRSITEACVWGSTNTSLAKRRAICKSIIYYLIKEHIDMNMSKINYVANEFDIAYKVDNTNFAFEDGDTDIERVSSSAIQCADQLGKQLRSLLNIPLNISTVQGKLSYFIKNANNKSVQLFLVL